MPIFYGRGMRKTPSTSYAEDLLEREVEVEEHVAAAARAPH
jgi:hypothetical protein